MGYKWVSVFTPISGVIALPITSKGLPITSKGLPCTYAIRLFYEVKPPACCQYIFPTSQKKIPIPPESSLRKNALNLALFETIFVGNKSLQKTCETNILLGHVCICPWCWWYLLTSCSTWDAQKTLWIMNAQKYHLTSKPSQHKTHLLSPVFQLGFQLQTLSIHWVTSLRYPTPRHPKSSSHIPGENRCERNP